MATGRVERRLAAILAADVAGYSRLMGADEEGTHEQLKMLLSQLVNVCRQADRHAGNGETPMICECPPNISA